MWRFNVNFWRHRERFLAPLYAREEGIIGRQRVVAFIYPVIILMVGIILNLCEALGPISLFYKIANSIHGAIVITVFVLYLYRRFPLSMVMSILCVVSQIELSAETIHCAFENTPYAIGLIIGNMVLSAIILLISIVAYLRAIPCVVAALSMSTFIFSIYMTDNLVLDNFLIIFFLAFLLLALLGWTLTSNSSGLERENSNLKDEQQLVLDVFHLSKEQLLAFMSLAREKKLQPEQTSEFLRTIGGAPAQQIRNNVAYYLRQGAIEFDKLSERLPELTTSELEICALILKDKKLKEISHELGKSPSNITCQRTNIRRKLGLDKQENLSQFLSRRMHN
ncbi:MAG: LuxR C-terminal-related transcriptional regulator [Alistipes sp.]